MAAGWMKFNETGTCKVHSFDLIKVCRQSRKTFLFLFCFFLLLRSADKVGRPFCFCSLRSADKVGRPFCFCSFSYYFFFIIILSYFSLPPRACRDFSVISQPISMKFGMLIVLDETKQTEYFFQVNRTRGRDRAWSQSFTMLYNRKNSIYCA